MVTPEFIYKKWCEICEREGRNVDPKWFTPEGKRAFVKSPAVIDLSKFAYRIVTPALSQNFKISDLFRTLDVPAAFHTNMQIESSQMRVHVIHHLVDQEISNL